ncbi:MAG: hypothetical protein J3R72DRAFT_491227 [Linnemannia gamsii]|nr:MAG: hypothetical protein J3R72DRAFT_491227 [Linnemannia gamsii]
MSVLFHHHFIVNTSTTTLFSLSYAYNHTTTDIYQGYLYFVLFKFQPPSTTPLRDRMSYKQKPSVDDTEQGMLGGLRYDPRDHAMLEVKEHQPTPSPQIDNRKWQQPNLCLLSIKISGRIRPILISILLTNGTMPPPLSTPLKTHDANSTYDCYRALRVLVSASNLITTHISVFPNSYRLSNFQHLYLMSGCNFIVPGTLGKNTMTPPPPPEEGDEFSWRTILLAVAAMVVVLVTAFVLFRRWARRVLADKKKNLSEIKDDDTGVKLGNATLNFDDKALTVPSPPPTGYTSSCSSY